MKKYITPIVILLAIIGGVGVIVFQTFFTLSLEGPMSERTLSQYTRCALRTERAWLQELYEKQVDEKIGYWGNMFCMKGIHKRGTTAQIEKVWLKILSKPTWAMHFFFRSDKGSYPPPKVYQRLLQQHKAKLLGMYWRTLRDDSPYKTTFGHRNAVFYQLRSLDPGFSQTFAHIKAQAGKYRTILSEFAFWLAEGQGKRAIVSVLLPLTRQCFFTKNQAPKGNKKAARIYANTCDAMLSHLSHLVDDQHWWGKPSKPVAKQATPPFTDVFEKLEPQCSRNQHARTHLQTQHLGNSDSQGKKIFTWSLDATGKLAPRFTLSSYEFTQKKKQAVWKRLQDIVQRGVYAKRGWIVLDMPKGTFFSCTVRTWFLRRLPWMPVKIWEGYVNMSNGVYCRNGEKIPFLTLMTHYKVRRMQLVDSSLPALLTPFARFPAYFHPRGKGKAGTKRARSYALIGPLFPGRYLFRYSKLKRIWNKENHPSGTPLVVQAGKTLYHTLNAAQ